MNNRKSLFGRSILTLALIGIASLAMLAPRLTPRAHAQTFDVYGQTSVTPLYGPVQVATTTTAASVNLAQYVGYPLVLMTETNATGSSTPTSTLKLQQSADNSNFADVAGGAFTSITTLTNSIQTLQLNTTASGGSNYYRVVNTISGTTVTNVASVVVIGRLKSN